MKNTIKILINTLKGFLYIAMNLLFAGFAYISAYQAYKAFNEIRELNFDFTNNPYDSVMSYMYSAMIISSMVYLVIFTFYTIKLTIKLRRKTKYDNWKQNKEKR